MLAHMEQQRSMNANGPMGPFGARGGQPVEVGGNRDEINFLFVSGNQTNTNNADLDVEMTHVFGPGGVIQRQLQHFHSTMSGLSRILNNMNRNTSAFSPLSFFEDLDDFPHLRREGFFDDSFYEVILSHSPTRAVPGQRGMRTEELENLPTTTYYEPKTTGKGKNKANEESDNKKNCVICLNDFQSGDQVRTLPCTHNFHKDCIDGWLSQKGCCPICRRNLT